MGGNIINNDEINVFFFKYTLATINGTLLFNTFWNLKNF